MKTVPPVVYLKAGVDPREPEPMPEPNFSPAWSQMFEEHRELALKSESRWHDIGYLGWILSGCGLVMAVIGWALWP